MGLVQLIPVRKEYSDKAKTSQYYPETHIKAVKDDNGTSLLTLLQEASESVENLRAEIDETEKAIAAALNDLNSRIIEINKKLTTLETSTEDNELVISAALNDLNDRINAINRG